MYYFVTQKQTIERKNYFGVNQNCMIEFAQQIEVYMNYEFLWLLL